MPILLALPTSQSSPLRFLVPGRVEPRRGGAAEYGEAEMAAWYRELGLLPGGVEHIVSAETSLSDTVQLVMADTGLASQPATSAS